MSRAVRRRLDEKVRRRLRPNDEAAHSLHVEVLQDSPEKRPRRIFLAHRKDRLLHTEDFHRRIYREADRKVKSFADDGCLFKWSSDQIHQSRHH